MKAVVSGSIAVLMMVIFSSSSWAETYHLGTAPKQTNISFTSETILETILGNVNVCSGSVTIDKESGSVDVSIPVDQMRTGISMRDGHLQSENWLNAKEYPTISFISKSAKSTGNGKWEVTGDFTLHGVKKSRTVTVEAVPVPDDKSGALGAGKWMRFKTEFSVKLADHGIKIAKMAEGKVNEEWKVKISLFGTTAAK